MEELVIVQNGHPRTDSLRMATKFGKRHKHVLRDIRRILSTERFLNGPDLVPLYFVKSSYLDGKGQDQENFIISRKGFTLLAMGFTGEKAMGFKIEFIEAFDRMEAKINQIANSTIASIPNFADPVKAAEAWIEQYRLSENAKLEIADKEALIQDLIPDAKVGQNLGFKDGSVCFATFAPTIGLGRNSLFELLRNEGILISTSGERYNEPYAKYNSWFDLKPGNIQEGPKKGKLWYQTRITPEGQRQLILRYPNGKPKIKQLS
jgi:anti-repressor protein